jgi:hypothetical protein
LARSAFSHRSSSPTPGSIRTSSIRQPIRIITRKEKAGEEQKSKIDLKKIIKGNTMDIRVQEGNVSYVSGSF